MSVNGTSLQHQRMEFTVAIGGAADMDGHAALTDCVENDPTETLAARFAVVHNTVQTAMMRPVERGEGQ